MIRRSVRTITLRCRQYINPPRRRRSYSAVSAVESVTVPCQSNGSITVDLYRPTNDSLDRNGSPGVLIYLPHGPSADNAEQDVFNISALHSAVPCPIAQINYRLSEDCRYPTPVHDVLCGFDWIVDNLLPKRGITRVGRSESIGQVAVCGEHIGGGLATALALTECRTGQPGIIASAVNNPVVDWVSMDNASKSKSEPWKLDKPILEDSTILVELQRLRYLRTRLFRKPENYFDPFASPILFFRSAGAEVPPPPQDIPVDDLEQLSLLEREDVNRQERDMADVNPDADSRQVYQRNPILRKASRRFPSKALGLRLPQFYISTGSSSPLRDQAGELAHLLRQSVVRQSKDATPGYSDFGRKVLMDDEHDELDEEQRALAKRQKEDAKRKIELHVNDGSGTWSDRSHGEARLNEVAMWLRHKLE